MLHILFVILKVLAIIIASILGFLLFLLLIVLFVPIRYRADVRKYDEIVVNARVNWLLRIVFVRVWFINQQLHLKLRVFGICIYDNLRPKKEKKPKKSSPNLKAKKFKKKEKKHKISTSLKSDLIKDNKVNLVVDQKDVTQKSEVKVEETRPQKELTISQVEESVHSNGEANIKLVDSTVTQTRSITLEEPNDSEDHLTSSEHKRGGIFSKINAFFRKIKTIILRFLGIGGKIKSIGANVKTKLKKLSDLVKELWVKKNKIIAFLKDEINKAGIKMAFRQVLKALMHCAPRKIVGFIRYGTGDPCSTGEAFAAAAFFYGKYGKSLRLVPDFEEEVLEAEVMVKGRIRIFTLLIIGIKLIRDKNFSKLLKNAKQLKEEL